MSSLYSEDYIDTCSQSYLKNVIENNSKFDFTTLNNRKNIVALQHYIIKYIEHNGKTSGINNILGQFYYQFQKQPYLFVDSPLVCDGFLNRFMTEHDRKIILDRRNNYFNNNKCKILYEKYQKGELTDEEKNQLFAFLIHNIDNDKYNKSKEYCAKKILDSNKNVNELNIMELKFYCKYVAKIAGKNGSINPEAHIMSDEPNIGGFQSKGLIFINKDTQFTPTLVEITETVCHETEHAIQYKELKNKNTRKALEMAYFELFEKYLSTKDYKAYHMNYKHSEIELDAEKFGFFYGAVVLNMLGRRDLSSKLNQIKREKLDKRNYYHFMFDKNKKAVPIDTFIVRNLDEIIKNHPEELNNYKVLNKIYEKNGERKSFKAILSGLMNQDFETRGIYDNYINYEILNDKLDSLSIKSLGKQVKENLFKSLHSIYKEKEIEFRNYCLDSDYKKYNKEQIIKTTNYQLKIIDKIITFVDKNFEDVLETKKDSVLTNTTYIYDFINGLQDFKLSNINNEYIRDNPMINEKYNELQGKIKSIITKFNKQYILDRIVDIPLENLNQNIKTLEGNERNLKDYLLKDLLPKMNGHMSFEINGNEVYIGNVIRYYKGILANSKDDQKENQTSK